MLIRSFLIPKSRKQNNRSFLRQKQLRPRRSLIAGGGVYYGMFQNAKVSGGAVKLERVAVARVKQ